METENFANDNDSATELLSVNNFSLSFKHPSARQQGSLSALNDINLCIRPGEIVGVIGESASGKTTLAHSIIGLHDRHSVHVDDGIMYWGGHNLLQQDEQHWRRLRGTEITMVFQDPMTSLDPLIPVRRQIEEVIHTHRKVSKHDVRQEALQWLRRVGITEAMSNRRPYELSGGQRQRALIAMAVANKPKLIIADEPTTALDASLQGEILDLLKELSREVDAAVLLITHDLGVISYMADRVYVMYAGQVVESAPTTELFSQSRMPYTWGLLQSAPVSPQGPRVQVVPIAGTPPTLQHMPRGCRFHSRCNKAQEICRNKMPALLSLTQQHSARCHYALDNGWQQPAVEPATITRQRQDVPVVLRINQLRKVFGEGDKAVIAVDNVELSLSKGETLAIVGESGCGKTTLGKMIVRLLQPTAGAIDLEGSDGNLKDYRRRVQLVFQDPYSSLNPRMKVIHAVAEPLQMQGKSKQYALNKAKALLERCGIVSALHNRYPHQFSGGQRQRIGITRALIVDPDIIVLDEPVSALDVSIQAQILNLLRDIQRERQTSFIFISHDLTVVRQLSDRTAVMQQGRIVELADTDEIFLHPQHEYTLKLLAALPGNRKREKQ